jgi:hypothetical protein
MAWAMRNPTVDHMVMVLVMAGQVTEQGRQNGVKVQFLQSRRLTK